MGKNINSLQLYRNTTQLYADKEAAISGITGTPTNDGTVKLARYKDGDKIKTIFGIYSIGSEISGSSVTGGSYTIYDSPQEVIAALEKRVKANEDAIGVLNGADTVSGSVAKSIKDAIEKLDATVTSTTGETFVKVQVVEEDGKITAVNVTEKDIASAKLLGEIGDTADKATAFGKIAEEAANRATAITAAIDALDFTDTAVTGSYVSEVNEANGIISVQRVALPTVAEIKSEGQAIVAVKEDKGVISATAGDIAAAHVTIADASNQFSGGTVQAALEELYSQAGAGSKVTVTEAEGTEGVLKVYTINQGGKAVGTINIPKDLVVTSGSVVKGTWSGTSFTEKEDGEGTALKLVIANQTDPVYINTLDLVKDHTAGNGIAISDTNVVSVKLADGSETFLTVSADGVKLSGVQDAINKAAAKATTKVAKADGTDKITLTSSAATDGSVTYTIGQNDIASAALLGTSADTETATTAFGKIAKEVADRKAAISGLNADVTSTNGTFVNVKVVEAEGKITAVTVSESDIASASGTNNAITAETQARTDEDAKIVAGVGFSTGDTYLIAANPSSGTSVSAASTVRDAIYTLDNALAAANKANALSSTTQTIAINATSGGTDVNVNVIADTAENGDNNPFVTFDKTSKKLIYCEAILDAGTY